MLCDLDDLQAHLQSLIQQMSQIHNRIVSPIEAKKINASNPLILLPKLLLLIKVTPYLDFSDIHNLSFVCVALRRTIYGPIGFKILSYTHSPYPITLKEIMVSPVEYSSSMEEQQADYEDEKFLSKERAQHKQILLTQYDKYKQKREHYEETVLKLKSEKTRVFRLKQNLIYLNRGKEVLEKENADYKALLKKTSEGFSEKLKGMDLESDDLVRDRNKLQNQKEALVGKVREYQNEIETIKAESDKYKEVLKKVKNYLLYKEL